MNSELAIPPESLEVISLSPPAPDLPPAVIALYSLWDKEHATGIWSEDLTLRLQGEAMQHNIDRFYLTPYGPQVAAALDVTRSREFTGLAMAHRVFVHPILRRKGVARRMFNQAIEDFKNDGGRILTLVAPSTGEAIGFYRSMGFQEIVRARDGEAFMGLAVRGRLAREPMLRFLSADVERWRVANSGDWAALSALTAIPKGSSSYTPSMLHDHEWLELIGPYTNNAEFTSPLEVGVSKHGYVVSVRPSKTCDIELPRWLKELIENLK